MESLVALFSDPTAWAALIALVIMEVVLGIDNLIFISILSNKLPEEQRGKARKLGIGLALVMRLILLSMIAWLVGLEAGDRSHVVVSVLRRAAPFATPAARPTHPKTPCY